MCFADHHLVVVPIRGRVRYPQGHIFEQVSIDDHQVAVAARGRMMGRYPGLMSGGGDRNSEVQCIVGNDHTGSFVNRQTSSSRFSTIKFRTGLRFFKNLSHERKTEYHSVTF